MRCFALVQLESEAGQLLAARARVGEESSWVHRCQLTHGHGGDHRCVDTTTECELEWDDSSTAPRISSPQSGGDEVSESTIPRAVNGSKDSIANESVFTTLSIRTEAQALDAIASALERISDVFDKLIDSGGRHR